MEEPRRGRNYRTLGLVSVLALLYIGWMNFQRTITGMPQLDGTIGVLLGLFICSRPAANMLDLLFAQRNYATSSEWPTIRWVALNGLVLFLGWLVITIGATQLIERAP